MLLEACTAISDDWFTIRKTGSWNKHVRHAFETYDWTGARSRKCLWADDTACRRSYRAFAATPKNGNTYICSEGLQKEKHSKYNVGLYSSNFFMNLTMLYNDVLKANKELWKSF